jgi:hypothetical protein
MRRAAQIAVLAQLAQPKLRRLRYTARQPFAVVVGSGLNDSTATIADVTCSGPYAKPPSERIVLAQLGRLGQMIRLGCRLRATRSRQVAPRHEDIAVIVIPVVFPAAPGAALGLPAAVLPGPAGGPPQQVELRRQFICGTVCGSRSCEGPHLAGHALVNSNDHKHRHCVPSLLESAASNAPRTSQERLGTDLALSGDHPPRPRPVPSSLLRFRGTPRRSTGQAASGRGFDPSRP